MRNMVSESVCPHTDHELLVPACRYGANHRLQASSILVEHHRHQARIPFQQHHQVHRVEIMGLLAEQILDLLARGA
jgi:hypothetical protein